MIAEWFMILLMIQSWLAPQSVNRLWYSGSFLTLPPFWTMVPHNPTLEVVFSLQKIGLLSEMKRSRK